MFIKTFSCLLNVWIILKLNAKQVSDETVLAHIPSFKQMLHIFLWQMPNPYPIFNIPTCFNISLVKFKLLLNWYYLLTIFLYIGYLEKCVTTRIYPSNCFVPLPALTDVWNWALRPQHSDWVPKIRQINFTNVIFKKTVCSDFEPSHLLYFGGPWQGLYSLPLPHCSTETLLPSPRLSSSSSSRELHCCYSCRMVEVKRKPWKLCSPAQRRINYSRWLRAASRWISCISNWGHSTTCSSLWPPTGTGSRKGASVAELRSFSPREKGSTD